MSTACSATAAAAITRRWIEQVVVGMELCPFAAPVLRDKTLRIAVCEDTDERALALAVLNELDHLQRVPEDELATALLVFNRALADFDDYLDFLAFAEELLDECGLDGIVQIASFHPGYRFDGAPADDAANYSNRAPLPTLHFLRESALTRALAHYPAPEQIPLRNIERLRALGVGALEERLAQLRQQPQE